MACGLSCRLSLALLVLAALLLSGCALGPEPESPALTAEERNARIMAIAEHFAATGDVQGARIALKELDLPDADQTVLALAESQIALGEDPDATERLLGLAQALGPLSRMASEYLASRGGTAVVESAPPTPTDTPLPPTETPVPTDTPEPTATPTDTPEPSPTPTDTPLPKPRVLAENQGLNVRGGPGTLYPVVGQMRQGDDADILARNSDGSWWQVALADGSQGWVYANLVTVTGPLEQVAVAQNIAPPPVQPTATPAPSTPTPAPAAEPPAPAPQPAGSPYAFVSYRLRAINEHGQRCNSGDHNIFVTVVDQAGGPIDGVRVREIYTGQVRVTGADSSGPGQVHYDIYRGGGGVVEVVDENNNPISPQSPGMSADWPPFDLMLAAGYCNCKPHPNPESCRAELESKAYLFAVGHYVYEVVFQRQY